MEKVLSWDNGHFFISFSNTQGGAGYAGISGRFFEQEFRDGLKWYAGCGTLLGAIWHEGFVPRDEKERDLQAQLLTMTGRIAQLAKSIGK